MKMLALLDLCTLGLENPPDMNEALVSISLTQILFCNLHTRDPETIWLLLCRKVELSVIRYCSMEQKKVFPWGEVAKRRWGLLWPLLVQKVKGSEMVNDIL